MSEQEQSLAESLNELEKLTQHALEVEGDERDQLIEQIKEKCEAEGLSSDEAEALIEEIGLVEANKRSADNTGGESTVMQGSSQKPSAQDVSQNLKVPGSGTVPDPVTKKVKARKGDKAGGEMTAPMQGSSSMPKTKAEAMSRFYDTLGKMKKADIMDNYEKIMNAISLDENAEVEDYNPVDVKDDIEALTEGEDQLSDAFKSKAATIFEAAVQAKVKETLLEKEVQLEETFEARIEEEVKTIREELVEQVDGYLNYVSEQWVEDNKLAIEKGVRTEITESFINGMKNLFNEHYITIPEDKVDVVDDLFEKVEDLEKQLNDQINETVELTKQVNQYKKEKVVRTFSEGLSENQAEKLKQLSEVTDDESTEEFEEKVQVIKENYFPKQVSKAETLVEEVDVNNELESEEQVTDEEVDDKMRNYMSAISRTLK
tara:strand:+ start:515 stop:1807 length:1293 start_codon:yes stop_codon:yes gene_type:complete